MFAFITDNIPTVITTVANEYIHGDNDYMNNKDIFGRLSGM
jgi:hypothetical protein